MATLVSRVEKNQAVLERNADRSESMTSTSSSDAEDSLRATWSIGPLRPWLKMLAERQLPNALRGRLDASDIVQQTLIDAWNGEAGFRGTTHGERMAWLRVI